MNYCCNIYKTSEKTPPVAQLASQNQHLLFLEGHGLLSDTTKGQIRGGTENHGLLDFKSIAKASSVDSRWPTSCFSTGLMGSPMSLVTKSLILPRDLVSFGWFVMPRNFQWNLYWLLYVRKPSSPPALSVPHNILSSLTQSYPGWNSVCSPAALGSNFRAFFKIKLNLTDKANLTLGILHLVKALARSFERYIFHLSMVLN